MSVNAAGTKADRPKPLDPAKSAKYVDAQGGLVMPPDSGKRILVWDTTGKAGASVVAFTNAAKRMFPLPFVVKNGPIADKPLKITFDPAAQKGKVTKSSLPVAKRRGDFIHQKTVLPETACRGLRAAHVERGNRGGLGHSAHDDEPMGGELARVLGGGVVLRRQCVGQGFDEAGERLGLEPSERLFLARRNEARNRYHATPCLFDDLVDRTAVFLNRLLQRQSDVKEKWRTQDRQVANGVKDRRQPLGFGNELLAGYRAPNEAVGVPGLPERPRRVEPNVVANRAKRSLCDLNQ